MQSYSGAERDSGISAYEIGPEFIEVEFTGAGIYAYTYNSAGRDHVENMKVLAASGKGLNSYINDHTKDHWEWRDVGGTVSFNAPPSSPELDPGPHPRLS